MSDLADYLGNPAPEVRVSIRPGRRTTTVTANTPLGPVAVELDIGEAAVAHDRLFASHTDPEALAEAWIDWLAGKGLPRLSPAAALGVACEVRCQAPALYDDPN